MARGNSDNTKHALASLLLDRDSFREAVFARDSYRCVICGEIAADAHHIMERRLWPDGGYYLDNGASLCPKHHIEAEQTLLTPEEIREAAGIANVLIPLHLKNETGLGDFGRLDKWGNLIRSEHQRLPGELFYDEAVQKVLSEAGMLEYFTAHVKYPRTPHLPSSPGGSPDDLLLSNTNHFTGREVVVTEKIDGQSASLYRDHYHARSIDSGYHPSQSWVTQLHARIRNEIPEGWRLCGENVYALHSIAYDRLPSYFLLFSVWNERNEALSWDDTAEWAELLGLELAPMLFRGPFEDMKTEDLYPRPMLGDTTEGFVVRTTDGFPYAAFRSHVAKFVRPNHVGTHDRHWTQEKVVPNKLVDTPAA